MAFIFFMIAIAAENHLLHYVRERKSNRPIDKDLWKAALH